MVTIAENSLRRVKADKVSAYEHVVTVRHVLYSLTSMLQWTTDGISKYCGVLPDGRFSHDKSDEDTVFGNILLPDTILDKSADDDTDYGGMVSIGNCEIGKRRVTVPVDLQSDLHERLHLGTAEGTENQQGTPG